MPQLLRQCLGCKPAEDILHHKDLPGQGDETLLLTRPWKAIANARSIRADNYVEVSAKTGENIDELLAGASIEATRRVLARRAVGGGPL